MSSEFLASGENVLDSNLGGAWDIINGYAGRKQDLGIARRFGGSAAAYSLRDIGAMNGSVVRVRRSSDSTEAIDDEERFSANQVQDGTLERWVNGELESTLPADSSQGLTVVVQHSLINSGTETTIKFYADSLTSGSPRFFSNDKTYKFYKGLSDNRYILQLTDSTNLIKASASDADKLPQDVTTYESVTGTLTSITVTSSSPAAAAYSLRKVRADYANDAVRIRRSSDDIEVDVAFDSNDKVSASSAITNVAEEGGESGQTTATTLGDFLGQTNITTGVAEMAQGSSSALSNATTTGFTLTQDGNLIGAMFPFSSNVGIGSKVSMTFTLSEDSGNATSSFRLFGTAGLGNAGSPSTIEKASSGTYTIEFEATAEARGIGFFDNVSGSVVTISNASITIENSAFVHTWYDQAGSNDAVQETAANQPKIAESGALLADGVTFDGTDDFLQTSGQVLTNNYTGARSLYGVCKINTGKSGTLVDYDNITTIEGSNFLISSNYNNNNTTTIHKNSNNNGYTQGTDTYNFTTSSQFTIGDRQGGSSAATRFNGSVQEIIAYDSDQSANRFKIESNINNYYGLYNDANEVTGDFTSSGAESFTANGTDGFTLTNSTSTAFGGCII
jgi:hypothetical protein